MREEYEMPEWAVVGADVVAVHYSSSAWAIYPYSEGMHMKVTRVLKTKVVCEATLNEGTTHERQHVREFQLGRNGLYERGNKYSPDQLVADGSKMIHMIRAKKALQQVQGKIVSLGDNLGKQTSRWMSSAKVAEYRDKLEELAEELRAAEEEEDRAQEMGAGDILVAK